jgi:hypothetical protein
METAKRCGLADINAILADVVSQTPAVIRETANLLPKGFPGQISDSILSGIQERANELAGGFSRYQS